MSGEQGCRGKVEGEGGGAGEVNGEGREGEGGRKQVEYEGCMERSERRGGGGEIGITLEDC